MIMVTNKFDWFDWIQRVAFLLAIVSPAILFFATPLNNLTIILLAFPFGWFLYHLFVSDFLIMLRSFLILLLIINLHNLIRLNINVEQKYFSDCPLVSYKCKFTTKVQISEQSYIIYPSGSWLKTKYYEALAFRVSTKRRFFHLVGDEEGKQLISPAEIEYLRLSDGEDIARFVPVIFNPIRSQYDGNSPWVSLITKSEIELSDYPSRKNSFSFSAGLDVFNGEPPKPLFSKVGETGVSRNFLGYYAKRSELSSLVFSTSWDPNQLNATWLNAIHSNLLFLAGSSTKVEENMKALAKFNKSIRPQNRLLAEVLNVAYWCDKATSVEAVIVCWTRINELDSRAKEIYQGKLKNNAALLTSSAIFNIRLGQIPDKNYDEIDQAHYKNLSQEERIYYWNRLLSVEYGDKVPDPVIGQGYVELGSNFEYVASLNLTDFEEYLTHLSTLRTSDKMGSLLSLKSALFIQYMKDQRTDIIDKILENYESIVIPRLGDGGFTKDNFPYLYLSIKDLAAVQDRALKTYRKYEAVSASIEAEYGTNNLISGTSEEYLMKDAQLRREMTVFLSNLIGFMEGEEKFTELEDIFLTKSFRSVLLPKILGLATDALRISDSILDDSHLKSASDCTTDMLDRLRDLKESVEKRPNFVGKKIVHDTRNFLTTTVNKIDGGNSNALILSLQAFPTCRPLTDKIKNDHESLMDELSLWVLKYWNENPVLENSQEYISANYEATIGRKQSAFSTFMSIYIGAANQLNMLLSAEESLKFQETFSIGDYDNLQNSEIHKGKESICRQLEVPSWLYVEVQKTDIGWRQNQVFLQFLAASQVCKGNPDKFLLNHLKKSLGSKVVETYLKNTETWFLDNSMKYTNQGLDLEYSLNIPDNRIDAISYLKLNKYISNIEKFNPLEYNFDGDGKRKYKSRCGALSDQCLLQDTAFAGLYGLFLNGIDRNSIVLQDNLDNVSILKPSDFDEDEAVYIKKNRIPSIEEAYFSLFESIPKFREKSILAQLTQRFNPPLKRQDFDAIVTAIELTSGDRPEDKFLEFAVILNENSPKLADSLLDRIHYDTEMGPFVKLYQVQLLMEANKTGQAAKKALELIKEQNNQKDSKRSRIVCDGLYELYMNKDAKKFYDQDVTMSLISCYDNLISTHAPWSNHVNSRKWLILNPVQEGWPVSKEFREYIARRTPDYTKLQLDETYDLIQSTIVSSVSDMTESSLYFLVNLSLLSNYETFDYEDNIFNLANKVIFAETIPAYIQAEPWPVTSIIENIKNKKLVDSSIDQLGKHYQKIVTHENQVELHELQFILNSMFTLNMTINEAVEDLLIISSKLKKDDFIGHLLLNQRLVTLGTDNLQQFDKVSAILESTKLTDNIDQCEESVEWCKAMAASTIHFLKSANKSKAIDLTHSGLNNVLKLFRSVLNDDISMLEEMVFAFHGLSKKPVTDVFISLIEGRELSTEDQIEAVRVGVRVFYTDVPSGYLDGDGSQALDYGKFSRYIEFLLDQYLLTENDKNCCLMATQNSIYLYHLANLRLRQDDGCEWLANNNGSVRTLFYRSDFLDGELKFTDAEKRGVVLLSDNPSSSCEEIKATYFN